MHAAASVSDIDQNTPIVVVGAGPKALAIHTKATVLRQLGFRVPPVVVIEKNEIAAHWRGRTGYTDGNQPLCTSPEKDLGFPYRSLFGPAIDESMIQYSWLWYLVTTGGLAQWVDSRRAHPTHRQWSEYLIWAAEKSALNMICGTVVKVEANGQCWTIRLRTTDATVGEIVTGQGIVLTGPGEPFRFDSPEDAKISDGRSFWTKCNAFALLQDGATIAVVGTGETAAAIVLAILALPKGKSYKITLINRMGMLSTREEWIFVNRYFSDPSGWSQEPYTFRSKFISSADKGVISAKARKTIDVANNVTYRAGEVQAVTCVGEQVEIRFGRGAPTRFDHAILATGFNSLSHFDFFPSALITVSGTWKEKFNTISKRIGFDLSLSRTKPKLHLPMLAGLQQGPGFPSLTCLGCLSDRILSAYVQDEAGTKFAHPRPGRGHSIKAAKIGLSC